MATSPSSFLVGMGTTFVILAAGFVGGLMFAKSAMEAPTSVSSRRLADELPAARVVLSTTAEAAVASARPAETAPPVTAVLPTADVQQTAEKEKEKDKEAERAERRKAEGDERAHRKRVAERQARREAARVAKQRDEQQSRQQPGIVAFDDERPRRGSFFGN
jgi:hypothetical protein